MTYYAERKSILNGQTQPINSRYGDRRAMERQYHLYCANACDGTENPFDVDSIELGSLEHGAIERKCYVKETPAPESEPETPEE